MLTKAPRGTKNIKQVIHKQLTYIKNKANH